MINTKNVRQQFLKILSKTKNISDSKTRSEIMKELFSLRDFIKEEYNYDRELPTLSHNFVSDILSDIDTLDLAIKNYILSIGYELPKHEAKDLNNIANLSSNYTNKYSYENTPVLEGRITNSRYIWHTNPNACQKCQDLDNTVYSNKSDVPDKPHPNCKCDVEEIEKKEDRCDCLDDLFEQIDNLVSSAENLLKEVNDYIKYFSDLINYKVRNSIAKTILDNCVDALNQIVGTISDFIKDYSNIKDKFYHSKEKCNNLKRTELNRILQKAIREYEKIIELLKNILNKANKAVSPAEDEKISEKAAPVSQEDSGNGKNNNKYSIEDVYKYIQENNKAPHWHVTENIYWDEVVKYPSLSYGKPTIEILTNLSKTALKIQDFVDTYYPGSKIQINSGWRSKGYNDTLGNAHPNSEHLFGNAIDFKIIGQDINSVYTNIKQYWKGRHYVHTTYGFIHVDRNRERGIDLVW